MPRRKRKSTELGDEHQTQTARNPKRKKAEKNKVTTQPKTKCGASKQTKSKVNKTAVAKSTGAKRSSTRTTKQRSVQTPGRKGSDITEESVSRSTERATRTKKDYPSPGIGSGKVSRLLTIARRRFRHKTPLYDTDSVTQESESTMISPNYVPGSRMVQNSYEKKLTESQSCDTFSPGGSDYKQSQRIRTQSAGQSAAEPPKSLLKTEARQEQPVTRHGLHSTDRIRRRPILVSVCTSSSKYSVSQLVSKLKTLPPDLIEDVRVRLLPYSGLSRFRFREYDPVDVMVLCHSINNRRFAITDVPDSLYDAFLAYCAEKIGKEKMAVIVHDFPSENNAARISRMKAFKLKQPTTFRLTGLALTCGRIDTMMDMADDDWKALKTFLENAKPKLEPEQPDISTKSGTIENKARTLALLDKPKNTAAADKPKPSPKHPKPPTSYARSSSDPNPTQRPGQDRSTVGGAAKRLDHTLKTSSQFGTQHDAGVHRLQQLRPISVLICTSMQEYSIEGLKSKLDDLRETERRLIREVRVEKLPYSNLDDFRFQSHDASDVMVLCHSISNRGFSITDVPNSLYDKYLKYCRETFGKDRVAVIVHDFDRFPPGDQEAKMDSFRKKQPTTFEMSGKVLLFNKLRSSDEIGEENWRKLKDFLIKMSQPPRGQFK